MSYPPPPPLAHQPTPIPPALLAPHPVLPLPSRRKVAYLLSQGDSGIATLRAELQTRADLIALEKSDPLTYGYEPPTFTQARALLDTHDELLLCGANRDGKSTFAAKYAVGSLVKTPSSIAAFFHSSERSSIDQQQPLVHSMLPPPWRALKKGRDTYLSYSKATGFSNFKFILPNKSLGLFFNYKQDVSVMEGYEFDVVWFDELVPLPFLEALAFRLSRDRRTKILLTFTPVKGYTPVVASYIAGAQILETRPATLLAPDRVHVHGCPPGHMPEVMRGRRASSAVLFFHIGRNPYGAHAQVRAKLAGAPESQIKIRAYGWADKTISSAFPKFSKTIHIITRSQFTTLTTPQPPSPPASPAPSIAVHPVPFVHSAHSVPSVPSVPYVPSVPFDPSAAAAAGSGSRFCVIDPAGAKNWFIKWYYATPEGRTIVYREWPDHAHHGEWALPPRDTPGDTPGSRLDWRPGPAQRSEAGRGIISYKQLILRLEGALYDEHTGDWDFSKSEKISRRLMDSRMGGSQVPGQDEGTSLIELLYDENRDTQGRLVGPRLDFEPAPGSGIDETLQMLSERMDYDETAPLSLLNSPRWYVLEDCLHSILAYQEYTALGTQRDSLKDIIDPDRYYVKAGCSHDHPQTTTPRHGGHW